MSDADERLREVGLDPAEVEKMHEAMVRDAASRGTPRRLTDSQAFLARDTLKEVLANFGLREEPEAMMLRALAADHLQAREDVKRLAAGLRETAGWTGTSGSPSGDSCWCHDGPCFRSEDGRATDATCRKLSALLAEVES